MTGLTIATTAVELIMKIAPTAIQGIEDMHIFATTFFERITGQQITPETRIKLRAAVDAAYEEFQAPIPPESER